MHIQKPYVSSHSCHVVLNNSEPNSFMCLHCAGKVPSKAVVGVDQPVYALS